MNSAKVALQRPHGSRLEKGREEDWGYHSGSLVVAREEKATAIGERQAKLRMVSDECLHGLGVAVQSAGLHFPLLPKGCALYETNKIKPSQG